MNSIAVGAGRLTFAAAKMYPPSEASCEAGSMRGARRSFLGLSNQSARRQLNGGNMAKARSRRVDLAERRGCDILCAWQSQRSRKPL